MLKQKFPPQRCWLFAAAAVSKTHYSPRLPASTSSTHYYYYYSTSTANNPRVKSVAVLGGGITGLSTAWYLSKLAPPSVSITLYEKSSRLGGWVNTKHVKSKSGSPVVFEQGPRTLRPWTTAGLVTIDMIRQLELESELVIIPKSSAAAKNRFIYYPDRLNQLPNSVRSVLFSGNMPVMKGIPSGILREIFKPARPKDLKDESVGSFLSRRFGGNLAYNLSSAVLHGIYGGDADRLSAKSVFPGLWRIEKEHGSILWGLLRDNMELESDKSTKTELYEVNQGILSRMREASVYMFKNGIETLSQALSRDLEKNPQVTIKTGADVGGVEYDPNQGLPLELRESGSSTRFSHLISTVFGPTLNSLLPQYTRCQDLASIEAVTVQVINLFFSTPNLLPVQGFGYLLPKSVPISQNPNRVLGVIFDSDAVPEKNASAATSSRDGTKVTVMMGGHWWRGKDTYPSDEEAVMAARDVLGRHLGITQEPEITNVALQKNCIPQYTVGHEERMGLMHERLKKDFGGRLSVAGASFNGVGLNDCIKGARDVTQGVLRGEQWTGLEIFSGEGRKWIKKV